MDSRHAYMIMVHHKFDILKKVLEDLDDERNDIFLHVDKKSKDCNLTDICSVVRHAQIYLVKRMNVYWGDYSQIRCVLRLLEEATKQGYHSYYHFMVGVEFPLKTQDYIHDFFEKNKGYEYIGFCYDDEYMSRIQYYHLFSKYNRCKNSYQRMLRKMRIRCVEGQKALRVNRVAKHDIEFKKGDAKWSITHELACYILSHKSQIEKIYHHSFCGDEIFIHTLVYNSEFWDKVYDKADEYHSCMRAATWEDPYNQFHMSDLNYLLESDRLFARKIDDADALQIIEEIKAKREL